MPQYVRSHNGLAIKLWHLTFKTKIPIKKQRIQTPLFLLWISWSKKKWAANEFLAYLKDFLGIEKWLWNINMKFGNHVNSNICCAHLDRQKMSAYCFTWFEMSNTQLEFASFLFTFSLRSDPDLQRQMHIEKQLVFLFGFWLDSLSNLQWDASAIASCFFFWACRLCAAWSRWIYLVASTIALHSPEVFQHGTFRHRSDSSLWLYLRPGYFVFPLCNIFPGDIECTC